MSPKYRIETHAHTAVVSPCGQLSPRELVCECARAGYSGIIITDHLTATLPIIRDIDSWAEKVHRFFSGFREARDAAPDFGLSVFPAFELSLTKVPGLDFLVYGIDEDLLVEIPDIYEMDLAVFKKVAVGFGALIFQAHPYRTHQPASPDLLDGLETQNGNPRHDSHNDLAVAFAAKHRLLSSSGSDAHRLEDIGRGGIVLSVIPGSMRELVKLWRDSPDEIELLIPAESIR